MVTPGLIGIDTSRLSISERTGTETYTYQLLKAVSRLELDDPIRLYFNRSPPPDLPSLGESVTIPFPRLWTHGRLSWEMLRRPPSVLFVPAHVVPLIHPRSVVTIHDLGFLHEPEAHPPGQRWMLDWTTRWSCTVARRIIAISDATKRDLVDRYRVGPERIVVVPHGVAPIPALNVDVREIRERLTLPEKFVLAVGTVQPRKNLGRLAKAVVQLARSGLPHHLVIAGKPGWMAAKVERDIAASGAADRVKLLGYVATADLHALYAAADALCFPSLYEGFGLPVLEAMSAGTPVVTSNRGALPEVVGVAGEVVDPLSTESIARGLHRVLTDDDYRSALIATGKQRAATFTWERSARATIALLREVRDA